MTKNNLVRVATVSRDTGHVTYRLLLERVDNDRGYSPDNCVWATRSEQQRNKRNNRIIEYDGERLLLVEWAERLKIKYSAIDKRLRIGWTVGEALGFSERK